VEAGKLLPSFVSIQQHIWQVTLTLAVMQLLVPTVKHKNTVGLTLTKQIT